MAITEKSIKLLWSNAAGRCSFTGCTEKLTVEQAAESAPHTLGEMAHIKGRRKDANRYDATQNDVERDDYENLILLCPNHHTLIDKKIQLTIFRIVQEQVANILKHANATRANIDLTLHNEQVQLHISDDGVGYDQQHPVNGVGILNIKSRVHVNHGSMRITSSPGNGFTLDVSLPLHYSPKD